MCFHTLRKDKDIQNSELVTFKPEVNSSVAQATWVEVQKSVVKDSVYRGTSGYASKEYFK